MTKNYEDEMIFKNFPKSTFVSGLSVAIVLMCFSATPSLAKESRIAVSPGAITFTCVPFKRSVRMTHFKKIIKKIKKAKKSGNTISKIITKDCLMSPKDYKRSKEKLHKIEDNCFSIDKNCAIEIEMDLSNDFSTYLQDVRKGAKSIHVSGLMVDKAPEYRTDFGDAFRIE